MIDRNNNFDLIRLIAALQVLYMHSSFHLEIWPGPRPFYTAVESLNGVVIFFIVSGFLVTDSYLSTPSTGNFALKRTLRIYPALIVNIVVLELSVFLTAGSGPITSFSDYAGYLSVFFSTAAQQWAEYFFPSPYPSMGAFVRYPSGVLWTLSVELTFYLALPLFLEAYRRSPRVGWFYIFGATLASWRLSHIFAGGPGWNDAVSLSVIPYFWVFAIGVSVRLMWPTIRNAFENKFLVWLALYVAVSAWMYLDGKPNYIRFYQVDAWHVAMTLALSGLIFSFAFTWPKPKLLRGFDISYGVYLYHMPVIYFMIYFGLQGRLRSWPVVFAASIAAGAISWVFVERPALNLRKKFSHPSSPSPSSHGHFIANRCSV